eukprot:3441115-Prymnesium_polylepis.2
MHPAPGGMPWSPRGTRPVSPCAIMHLIHRGSLRGVSPGSGCSLELLPEHEGHAYGSMSASEARPL